MKSFKHFLNEALIDVDVSDINLIYAPMAKAMKELNTIFKKNIDRLRQAKDSLTQSAISRTIQRELLEVKSKYQPANSPLKTIDSSKLKSKTAQEAHAVNPVKINIWFVGPPRLSNSYNVETKEIHICIPNSVADAMMTRLNTIPLHQLEMLQNETSDIKHKSTIRHELTHWIDDSIHNFYITKTLTKAQDLSKTSMQKAQKYWDKAVKHGEKDIYLAPIEITPMVNQIAELKRRLGEKKYNSITWSQLVVYLPSLSTLNQQYGAEYRKKMFSRLARENLMGKSFLKSVA